MSSDYLTSLKEFVSRFKVWKPGVYIYVDGGVVQYAYGNCDIDLNLFDNDNEQDRTVEEKEPGEESYEDTKNMWDWMIDSGIKDGSLKEILK
jgi:hypothetical protein